MKHIITTALALSFSLGAMAWGQKGHDTTCAIAQQYITPKTSQRIAEILDGRSIVYWSNWLDNAVHSPEYEYAKTWHYKNIDADQRYEDVPPCESGDVVTALTTLVAQLKGYEAAPSSETKEEEALALKMLVHLMGDLHQPMHMGRGTDAGGNRIMVKFFNRDLNLHTVWDTNLVESAHAWSHTEWVEEIGHTTPEAYATIAAGTIDDWGRDTYHLSQSVYDDSPEGCRISYDYVAKWAPTVEMQFLKGGIRLATLLNYIFN